MEKPLLVPGSQILQVKCAEIVARFLPVVGGRGTIRKERPRWHSRALRFTFGKRANNFLRGFSKLRDNRAFFSRLCHLLQEKSLANFRRWRSSQWRPRVHPSAVTIIVRVFFSPNRMVVPSMSFSPTSSMCSSARGASSFTEIDLV